MALREEDGSEVFAGRPEENKDDINKFLEGEANFFLQDGQGQGMDLKLKEGEGYDEVETVQKKRDPQMGAGEEDEDDDDANDKLEQADPDSAQRMLEELYSNRKLTESELR